MNLNEISNGGNTPRRGDFINWNQVFYFSEIASLGSIKEAAEKLNLSPSTLSEHLSQLEHNLDLRLFHRQHRKLQLTEEGAQLFHHAKQMFESGKRFMDVISPLQLGCYPISIGIVAGASYVYAYKIVGEYIARSTGVSANLFHFDNDTLERALIDAKLDFGFTDQRTERRNIVQTSIGSSPLRFFVSTKHAHRGFSELVKSMPLLICRSGPKNSSIVEKLLEQLNLPPKGIIASEYPGLIEDLCRQGVGIAVLSRAHFDDSSGLRMLRPNIDLPPLSENLFVTWTTSAENSEAIRHLRLILKEFS